MKRNSTNAVLERIPWSVPSRICSVSPFMLPSLQPVASPAARRSRPDRASLLPSPHARLCAAPAPLRRAAGAPRDAIAWRAARRHRRTESGSGSAPAVRPGSWGYRDAVVRGSALPCRPQRLARGRERLEGLDGREGLDGWERLNGRDIAPLPPVLPCPRRTSTYPSRRRKSGRDFNLDRPRLGLVAQRQPDGQDAVLVLGGDAVRIDRLWQRERPGKRAVPPLDVMELLLFRLVRHLLLALDGQHEVLDVDVDVLARHVGELGVQHQLVIAGLVDIHRGRPRWISTRPAITS